MIDTILDTAYVIKMTRRAKLIQQMRHNPKGDWTIEDLISLATACHLSWRQPGTSHVTFVDTDGNMLTVPSHKPIKPVYIRKFLLLLASWREDA